MRSARVAALVAVAVVAGAAPAVAGVVPGVPPSYSLRMSWGPASGTVGTVIHLRSVDPCPVVAGLPDQVPITVMASGRSYGGGGSFTTNGAGVWSAAVRFTNMSVNGPDPGLVPPKTPRREPPPTNGTRYSVVAECHSRLPIVGSGYYKIGTFTYRTP